MSILSQTEQATMLLQLIEGLLREGAVSLSTREERGLTLLSNLIKFTRSQPQLDRISAVLDQTGVPFRQSALKAGDVCYKVDTFSMSYFPMFTYYQ